MATEAQVVIHLRSGGVLYGNYATMTEDEFEKAADIIGNVMTGSGGWRLTIDHSGGGKALVPKDSIDYVSMEWREEGIR